MFKDTVLYVYYDKASERVVDSFVHDTDKAAMRFITVRIGDAVRAKNYGLLSFWRDCEVYKIDLSKDVIQKEIFCELSKLIPAEMVNDNEKN